jgi:hypothetical protein
MALSEPATGDEILAAARALDRRFRDAHTIHQHITSSPKAVEQAGGVLLGLAAAPA